MKFTIFCLAAAAATAAAEVAAGDKLHLRATPAPPRKHAVRASPDEDLCDIIGDDLPSMCDCSPNTVGGKIECSIDIFSDTVNFIANVQPCASPADIEFEISDSDLGVDYTKTISLQDTESFDIPGLTFGIPGYASAGAVCDVTAGGDLDDVTLSLALDACATVMGYKVCGSDLTSELPVTVIEGTYDFSNICN